MSKKITLDINKTKELYLSGLSTIKIAEIFGCDASVIQNVLRPLGILRNKGVRKILTDEQRLNNKREYDKKYNSSEKARESHRRRCLKDKHKVKARWTVENNIRAGKIPRVLEQLCIDCDSKAQEYDHYLGYNDLHMLDIEPVCIKCHKIREMKRINNEI